MDLCVISLRKLKIMDSCVHDFCEYKVGFCIKIACLGYIKIMNNTDDYFDFRDFLKKLFQEKKSRNFYSHRIVASHDGLDTNYLAKILIKKDI